VPFAYYSKLSRAAQAVYRKSDAITEIRLATPAELRPRVEAVELALLSEDRAATQRATDRLILGLTEALRVPPVRVEVLAARPHAGWGELHGLYTATAGRRPKIQLWMRTARQKRVVAFRTYLRTLLHEVGHHVDYALLRLPESYHTEGFYKRESSLFHQLVTDGRHPVLAIEDYARQPITERLKRLERTADELADAARGRDEAALARRPDDNNWAAKEVLCHLRDTEELFMHRFEQLLAMDEPRLLGLDPDRWADERQYLRNDAIQAGAAFRKRRQESLDFLRKLTPDQWKRGGVHVTRGRMTFDDLLALMAWHDDNHLDQLKRALDGRV
jgi:uncharacterized damage-inducible protein DinB